MSGGSFDYMYGRIEETYCGRTEDKQLDMLIKDLCKVLYELELFVSGDTNEKTYRNSLNKFKKKWLNDNSKRLAVEEIKQKAIEKIRLL